MDGILGTQIILAAFAAALAILAVADGVWGTDPRSRRGFGPAWQAAPDDEAQDGVSRPAGPVMNGRRQGGGPAIGSMGSHLLEGSRYPA